MSSQLTKISDAFKSLFGTPPTSLVETPSAYKVTYGNSTWVLYKHDLGYYSANYRLAQYILSVFDVRWEDGTLVSQTPLNIDYFPATISKLKSA